MFKFSNMYNKHYIRVVDTLVVKGFSDAFETPLETDICINEKGGRHFEIDGVINPPLINRRKNNFNGFNHMNRMNSFSSPFVSRFASELEDEHTEVNVEGTHIYRYDTELRKATQEELIAELESIKSKEV